MHFNWLFAVGLFFIAAMLDALYALYTVAIIKTKAARAASIGFLSYLLQAVGIVSYVHNVRYLIPLATGAMLGTFLVVKREEMQQKAKEIK